MFKRLGRGYKTVELKVSNKLFERTPLRMHTRHALSYYTEYEIEQETEPVSGVMCTPVL